MPRKISAKPTAETLPRDFLGLVQLHPLMAVHDDVGYKNAMEIINALTRLTALTQGQIDYLESLSVLVGAYEDDKWETSKLDPVDLLRALMDEHGMNASDLGRLLGERSLGPKILSRQRELSKTHIRKLAQRFSVRADLFL